MKRENFSINENETIMRYGVLVPKNSVYQEYLKNEPIELVKDITENYIRVQSDCTRYINRSRLKLIELDELMNNVRTLQKVAKENDVKLKGANLLKKFYKENYQKYKHDVLYENKIFDELLTSWKETELFMGLSDDFYYQEVLQEKEFFLQKRNTTTSIVSKIKDKNNRVLEFVSKIKSGAKYISIDL